MPKGKRKGKSDAKRQEIMASSDDESIMDNGSENSAQSDLKSIQDEAEIEENTEKFEEKLGEAIDGLQQKSASGRAGSLTSLRAALCRRLVPDMVMNNRATIADALERALKKGRGAEQIAAAKLAPILCIQLGEDHCEELVRVVKPAFLIVLTDKSVDASIRAECCQSLAVISFVSGGDMGDILDLMRTFETIFSGSYLKGDGSLKVSASAEGVIHAAALDAWTLLLALCSPADVYSLLGGSTTTFSPSLSQLTELLLAPSLEVRISAGVALSLAYELGLEFSEAFGQDELDTIIAEVEQLAKDSNKFRAKKDRKTQRATFRDVLRFFEEDSPPEDTVRVGTERVTLDTWSLHVRYQRLAGALSAGLQAAAGAFLLREALMMGPAPAPPVKGVQSRGNKLERHLQNAAAFKARTISRAKNRDKRSAVIVS